MKNKAFNAFLVLTVVVVLGVCAFYVRVGATADAVVVLKSSGMTCGSCAAKITKALQNERGVAATEVDLEGGWVIAGYTAVELDHQAACHQCGVAYRSGDILYRPVFERGRGASVLPSLPAETWLECSQCIDRR